MAGQISPSTNFAEGILIILTKKNKNSTKNDAAFTMSSMQEQDEVPRLEASL